MTFRLDKAVIPPGLVSSGRTYTLIVEDEEFYILNTGRAKQGAGRRGCWARRPRRHRPADQKGRRADKQWRHPGTSQRKALCLVDQGPDHGGESERGPQRGDAGRARRQKEIPLCVPCGSPAPGQRTRIAVDFLTTRRKLAETDRAGVPGTSGSVLTP